MLIGRVIPISELFPGVRSVVCVSELFPGLVSLVWVVSEAELRIESATVVTIVDGAVIMSI